MQTTEGIEGEAEKRVCTKIDLSVINIGMKTETMATDELTKGEHVADEEKWSKQRSLRHMGVNWSRGGAKASKSAKLCTVGKAGIKPGECSASETKIAG